MGIDWITRCAPTWERSWDRERLELNTPNLFTKDISPIARTFRAVPCGQRQFVIGELVQLRSDGDALNVVSGVEVAAVSQGPIEAVLEAVKGAGHGIGCGRVVEVHQISGAIEVLVL